MIMKISELRMKDVIESDDGRRLGYIHDLEIDPLQGRIQALLLPGSRRWHRLFSHPDETSLPWEQIRKLGVDVILVQTSTVRPTENAAPSEERPERRSWDDEYSFFDI